MTQQLLAAGDASQVPSLLIFLQAVMASAEHNTEHNERGQSPHADTLAPEWGSPARGVQGGPPHHGWIGEEHPPLHSAASSRGGAQEHKSAPTSESHKYSDSASSPPPVLSPAAPPGHDGMRQKAKRRAAGRAISKGTSPPAPGLSAVSLARRAARGGGPPIPHLVFSAPAEHSREWDASCLPLPPPPMPMHTLAEGPPRHPPSDPPAPPPPGYIGQDGFLHVASLVDPRFKGTAPAIQDTPKPKPATTPPRRRKTPPLKLADMALPTAGGYITLRQVQEEVGNIKAPLHPLVQQYLLAWMCSLGIDVLQRARAVPAGKQGLASAPRKSKRAASKDALLRRKLAPASSVEGGMKGAGGAALPLGGNAEELTLDDVGQRIARLFRDGVLLCELVGACEAVQGGTEAPLRPLKRGAWAPSRSAADCMPPRTQHVGTPPDPLLAATPRQRSSAMAAHVSPLSPDAVRWWHGMEEVAKGGEGGVGSDDMGTVVLAACNTSLPRTVAVARQNTEVALEVVRSRAAALQEDTEGSSRSKNTNERVRVRHMWNGDVLRRGDSAVAWELLLDVHDVYATVAERGGLNLTIMSEGGGSVAGGGLDESVLPGSARGLSAAACVLGLLQTEAEHIRQSVLKALPRRMASPPPTAPSPAPSAGTNSKRSRPVRRLEQQEHSARRASTNTSKSQLALAKMQQQPAARQPRNKSKVKAKKSASTRVPEVEYSLAGPGGHACVPIWAKAALSPQQRANVAAWMQQLASVTSLQVAFHMEQCPQAAAAGGSDLLLDPESNGVALCSAVHVLEVAAAPLFRSKPPLTPFNPPKTVPQLRGNVRYALRRLEAWTAAAQAAQGGVRQQQAPPRWPHWVGGGLHADAWAPSTSEALAQGDSFVAWGLLRQLADAFPLRGGVALLTPPSSVLQLYKQRLCAGASKTSRRHGDASGKHLPLPGTDLPPHDSRVQFALLEWLRGLHLLMEPPLPTVETFAELAPYLRDGHILGAALVHTASRRETPLPPPSGAGPLGLVRATTAALRRQNMLKVISAARAVAPITAAMGPAAAAAAAQGEVGALAGIAAAVFQAYAGTQTLRDAVFGPADDADLQCLDLSVDATVAAAATAPRRSSRRAAGDTDRSQRRASATAAARAMVELATTAALGGTLTSAVHTSGTAATGGGGTMSLGGDGLAAAPEGAMGASSRSAVTFATQEARHSMPRDPLSPPPPSSTVMSRDSLGGGEEDRSPPAPPQAQQQGQAVNRHAQRQARARAKAQKQLRSASAEVIPPALPQQKHIPGVPRVPAGPLEEQPPLYMPEGGMQDAARLAFEWLCLLGIQLQQPWALETSHAPEFADGLVLARAVEVCEHATLRSGIPGIEVHPTAPAAKLANIRRALEVLQLNKRMPLRFLWSELEIREGDTGVIVPLLMHMRHAYKHVKGVKGGK